LSETAPSSTASACLSISAARRRAGSSRAAQTASTGEQLGNFPRAFSHLSLINAEINLDYQLDHGAGSVEPVLSRTR